MKAIVILPFDKPSPDCINSRRPQVGDIVTVIDEKERYGLLWFFLEGFNPHEGFLSENFAPVDDLDETELVTEEFKEKYYVPA